MPFCVRVLIAVGALSALIYFFFSKAHTGAFGGVATFGIWLLMIGFGASFGFTVMARISLFVNRMQFLNTEWIQPALDSSNEHYNNWYPIVFYLMLLAIVAYIIYEFVSFLKRRSQPQSPAQ